MENNDSINNQNIKSNNETDINLPNIFDNNLTISINKENNKYSTKNKLINLKKSYITNNNK